MLIKSQRVLEWRQRDGGVVLFDNEDEDTLQSDATQVYIPESDWEAFGKPESVTVTIQPGDLLNGADGDEIDCHVPEPPLSERHPRNAHYLPGQAAHLSGS
jgi:hypothetical protein